MLTRGVAVPCLACLLFAAVCVSAADAPEWPQFHGPRRDNTSTETGLLQQWPEGGPKLVWTATGIGHGFCTVAIAKGLIYTTGNVGADTRITALTLDGKAAWTATNGPACRHQHSGTRSIPTLDGDRLYHLNADGDLACLEARSGKPVWALNILKRFGGRNTRWGLAESPLVDGRKVIVTPGGEAVTMIALDKATGKLLWACKGGGQKPGYASAVVFEHQGLRQIATLLAESAIGVHADTGALLWQVEHTTPFDENIFTPLFHDGRLFFATGHARGGRLLRLRVEGQACSAELVWRTDKLDAHHGGIVLHGGHLYGFCHGNYKSRWDCLELATGKLLYSERTPAKGAVTYADGRLYAVDERGLVELIKPVPTAREVVSRFQLPKGGRGPVWAHPVVCGRRLYLRHADTLYAYGVGAD